MLDKNSLVSIFDADTLVYLTAYQNRLEENVDDVLFDTDTFVQAILTNTSCTHYIGFLGGSKCFRYDIAVTKPYKGNRPVSPDWYIKWGGIIKAHLRDVWHFKVVNNIEADDGLSIASEDLKRLNINHILVHSDKDIRQKSGNHYNLRTHQREYISGLEAMKNFYKLLLEGDVADNLKFLRGIGKKKASQYIDGLQDLSEMRNLTIQLFTNQYGKDAMNKYSEAFNLFSLLNYPEPYTNLELEYIEVDRTSPFDNLNEVIADIWG